MAITILDENDKKELQEQINSKANQSDLTAPFTFKGSTTYSALPTSGNAINDTFYCTDTECNYSWNGDGWYQSSSPASNEGKFDAANIVQETGDSEDKVISQKASTELMNRILPHARKVTIESSNPIVDNYGIKNPTVGGNIDNFIVNTAGYKYHIYPNLPIGTYSVSTLTTVSANYPYYALLVDSLTGIIVGMALPSTGAAESISGEVTVDRNGLSLYLVSTPNGFKNGYCKVEQIVNDSFPEFVEGMVGDEESMRVGRETVAELRHEYADYNLSKKLFNFAWMTDTHYNSRTGETVGVNNIHLFAELCNERFLDAGVVGGDTFTSTDLTRKQALNAVSGITRILGDASIPIYHIRGNHDVNAKCMTKANPAGGTTWTPSWSDTKYYVFGEDTYIPVKEATWDGESVLYVEDTSQRITPNLWSMLYHSGVDAVFDSDNPLGGYFYKDFEREKIRIIVTNCYDDESVGESITWGAVQTKFIANSALNLADKSTPSEWSIILFSHDLPTGLSSTDSSAARWRLIEILEAFKNGGAFSGKLLDGSTLSVDYGTQGSGNIIATIHGHSHTDLFDTSYGWNNIGTYASYGTAANVGSSKEFMISVFSVDTDNKVLYETRIGHGMSRKYSFGETIGLITD